jgi:hypothetical protein
MTIKKIGVVQVVSKALSSNLSITHTQKGK